MTHLSRDAAALLLDQGLITRQEFEEIIREPGRNKFGAKKVEIDGLKFDSKAEGRRYSELKILEQAGEISKLKCQVRFPLDVNGYHVADYIADFQYYQHLADRPTVEDVKGYKKGGAYAVFSLKKKLMKAIYDIDVKETK